jgi:hypothetical protein
MRRSRIIIAAAFVLSVGVLSIPNKSAAQIELTQDEFARAFACGWSGGIVGFGDSCGAENYEQVFVGTLRSVHETPGHEFIVTMTPEEIFRGNPIGEITATTSGGGCPPEIRNGDRWLFALRRDEKTKELILAWGSPSGPLTDSGRMIARLRRLKSMKDKGQVKGEVRTDGQGEDGARSNVPVANHKVVMRQKADGHEYSAVTDKLGEFEFEPLPVGEYELIANREPGWWTGDDGHTTVTANECRDYHIELKPDGSIAGRVLVDGAAPSRTWDVDVIEAEEMGLPGDTPTAGSAFTDDDGRFVVHGLRPGRYVLGIEIAGVANWYDLKVPLYAPGTKERNNALIVETGKTGKANGVEINIPSNLIQRTVR